MFKNNFDFKLNLAELSNELLESQKNDWEQCRQGYESLSTIKLKEFIFDGFTIKLQFNSGRMISTSAKVDEKSIKERKCFLCKENLPQKQESILFKKDDFLILCNPFPIFPEHFTIPSILHLPQNIKSSFEILLDLSKELSKYYSVFYNGPKCGASAPDHLHFQAGTKNFMPLDYEFMAVKKKYGSEIHSEHNVNISAIDDGLRKIISIESSNSKKIIEAFNITYQSISTNDDEPLMNIHSFYENDLWRIIIFLRSKHRPSFYFENGEKQIILSPAAVDIGGVCVTPREEDFLKITKIQIEKIFKEVFVSAEKFKEIIAKLESSYHKKKSL